MLMQQHNAARQRMTTKGEKIKTESQIKLRSLFAFDVSFICRLDSSIPSCQPSRNLSSTIDSSTLFLTSLYKRLMFARSLRSQLYKSQLSIYVPSEAKSPASWISNYKIKLNRKQKFAAPTKQGNENNRSFSFLLSSISFLPFHFSFFFLDCCRQECIGSLSSW